MARTDPRIRYTNGDGAQSPGSFPQTTLYRVYNLTRVDATRTGRVGAIEFDCSCPKFELLTIANGTGSYFRVFVDGQLSANSMETIANDGTLPFVLFDFSAINPSPVNRKIRVEFSATGAIGGIKLDASGGVLSAPSSPQTMSLTVLGDSFIEGTAGTNNISYYALAPRCAQQLGFLNYRCSGFGSTGWAIANTSQTPNWPAIKDRITSDGVNAASDVYIIAAGLNDATGIQSTVAATLDTLRAGRPKAMIYVVLGWNPTAPTPRSGNAATKAAEIAAACAGRGGVKVLDPNLVVYTNSDGTHPDLAGHIVLGDWLANQIKADLGL